MAEDLIKISKCNLCSHLIESIIDNSSLTPYVPDYHLRKIKYMRSCIDDLTSLGFCSECNLHTMQACVAFKGVQEGEKL